MTMRIAVPLAVLATVLSVSGAFAQTLITQVAPQRPRFQSAPPPDADLVERGKWLFRQKGCYVCHGSEGQGGVPNRNSVKETIPRLALAEQMKLYEPEDVSAIVDQMKRGVQLDALVDSPPVPRFNVVLAQYHSIQEVIRKGNPAGKKDPQGPAPLSMPAWERELADTDIDAIIAYLLGAIPGSEQVSGSSR